MTAVAAPAVRRARCRHRTPGVTLAFQLSCCFPKPLTLPRLTSEFTRTKTTSQTFLLQQRGIGLSFSLSQSLSLSLSLSAGMVSSRFVCRRLRRWNQPSRREASVAGFVRLRQHRLSHTHTDCASLTNICTNTSVLTSGCGRS